MKRKTRLAQILTAVMLVALWGDAAAAPKLEDEYDIDPASVHESQTELADGTPVTRLQFLATPRSVAAVSDQQKGAIYLIFDGASGLTWWLAGAASPRWLELGGGGWVLRKAADGQSLVGFSINSSAVFGVRTSSARAGSLQEAQSLALAELAANAKQAPRTADRSELNARLAAQAAGFLAGGEFQESPRTDPKSFREINLHRLAEYGFFAGMGSNPIARGCCKILDLTPRPYGWDVTVQGPEHKNEFLPRHIFALSADFRLIAPGYSVTPDTAEERPWRLPDGTEMILASFVAGSLEQPERPRLDVTLVQDVASHRIWWMWKNRLPSLEGQRALPAIWGVEKHTADRMAIPLNELWTIARGRDGSLAGFIVGCRGMVAMQSSESAPTIAEARAVVLRQISREIVSRPGGESIGFCMNVGTAGLTSLHDQSESVSTGVSINIGKAMRERLSTPLSDGGSGTIRRAEATERGWMLETSTGKWLYRITLTKNFEIDGIEPVPVSEQ